MNERIRELAEQAREYAITRHPVSNIVLLVNSEKFEVKFAELIVKECANRATWAQDTGAGDIGEEVLKHFGVSE